jgi:hypothetical protein
MGENPTADPPPEEEKPKTEAPEEDKAQLGNYKVGFFICTLQIVGIAC